MPVAKFEWNVMYLRSSYRKSFFEEDTIRSSPISPNSLLRTHIGATRWLKMYATILTTLLIPLVDSRRKRDGQAQTAHAAPCRARTLRDTQTLGAHLDRERHIHYLSY